MIWKKRRKQLLTSLAFIGLFQVAEVVHAGDLSLFKEGSHCVAYKVQKKFALIRTVDVVSKNCKITAMVLPDLNDVYYVQVEVPIKSFNSGEPERDRDVEKILGIKEQDNLTFTSKKMTKLDWAKAFKEESYVLDGELNVAKVNYPVKAKIKLIKTKDSYEVDGVVVGSFKNFKIKPPVLVGGFAAKVLPQLDLHFRIQAEQTLGAESILPK